MAIYCRNLNSSRPAKYKTNAESNVEQFSYFNQKKKDKLYNKFLAKRILSDDLDVIFQIDSLVEVSKNGKIKLFEAVSELKDLTKKTGRSDDKDDLQENLNALIQETVQKKGKSGEDLIFFHDNNNDKKNQRKKRIPL